MATTAFNELQFENKLVNLKDSQESINTLSAWCLQNKDHHKKIVNCWLHCLKRVKIEQRLSLFYLANDVIQYSKRKHYQFVESWGTALQKATTLVRDDKVKSRIMRIFKIWDERGVYDEAFISDLCGLLTTNVKKKTETNLDSSEFQPSVLFAKIRECKLLENDTDIRFKKVKENLVHLTDANNMRTSLKDRRHGTDVVAEVDAGVKKMEAYVKALELEIAEREKLIDILRQAALFYESQRGEAKIVCNAYRNFGNKVKLLKRKLDDLLPTLSDSPIPSPDANAPSPSPDSDFDLTLNEKKVFESKSDFSENNGLDFTFISSTFMGNSQFSEINLQRDVFNDKSYINQTQTPNSCCTVGSNGFQNENTVRPIEVISTRDQKEDVSFNITDFIKSLLPSGVAKQEGNTNSLRPQPQAMEPLQPPPMPPIFTTNDAFSVDWKSDWGQTENAEVGTWNHESDAREWNIPPPVQEPWREQQSSSLNADTPESPPIYEKKGLSQPVEYDDSLPTTSLLDVDHRTLLPLHEVRDMDHRIGVSHRVDVDHRKLNKMGPKDVDHRNLISLTGSPRKEAKPLPPPPAFIWPEDQDYRHKLSDIDFRVPQRTSDFSDVLNSNFTLPQTSHIVASSDAVDRKDVNVESIDMDVSEEDEEDSRGLIQLEEDTNDRVIDSINSSFFIQSNLSNFNMSSSFIDSVGSNTSMNEDVDERLKSIFGGVTQNSGVKLISPEDDTTTSIESQIPRSHPETQKSKNENEVLEQGTQLQRIQLNGFDNNLGDRNEYFRRDVMWQQDGQSEQSLPCSPNVHSRSGAFGSRMERNSPRLLRGRLQNRFSCRSHHPRTDLLRARMPFRSRLPPPIRGARW